MTVKYAVIGNPVAHSLSPAIHHHFAAQTNQSLTYERLLIGELGQAEAVSLEQLGAAIKTLEQEGYQGLNVTHPFKEKTWQWVKSHGTLTERAQIAGAVNTLIFQQGQWQGDNTDGVGFIRALQKECSISACSMLILGAGGAVRGIIAPLLKANPAQLTLTNRTIERAIQLRQALQATQLKTDAEKIVITEWEKLHEPFDLIINGTSAGLHQSPLSLPSHILHAQTLCYDLSYSLQLTPFLSWAKKEGATHLVDGKTMLIEQAAEAFALWRGVHPDTSSILALLS